MEGANNDGAPLQIKTQTIWKSRTPFWDEEYEFDLTDAFNGVCVEVYNKNKFTKDTLIGCVRLPKLSLELDNRVHELWLPVMLPNKNKEEDLDSPRSPRETDKKIHAFVDKTFSTPSGCNYCGKLVWGARGQGFQCDDCGYICHAKCQEFCKATCGTKGSLRLKYKYTEEYVLPLPSYAKLLELMRGENLEAFWAYGKVTDEREYAAKTMVRISEYMNDAVSFINKLNAFEVQTSDIKTIFRANSIASKSVDYYMKYIGMNYLINVLKPVMDEILKMDKSCEIDQTRLEKGEDLEVNKAQLFSYVESIVNRIFESVSQCPSQLREIFFKLQEEVSHKFPENEEVKFTCVSGYLFLRFFNAAILGPKLFGLCPDHPNQRVSRTLTLISKTVQQLANLLRFDGQKEPYMTVFNEFILKNMDRMKYFIRKIASIPEQKTKQPRVIPREKTVSKKKEFKSPAGEEEIDVELELASLHRALMRVKENMEEFKESPHVQKLFEVLDSMEAVYQKRRAEAEAEREKQAQKMIDDEMSLEEFLGLGPGGGAGLMAAPLNRRVSKRLNKTVSQAMMEKPSSKPPGGMISLVVPERTSTSMSSSSSKNQPPPVIDLDVEVSNIKFQLKDGCLLSMKEIFYICDRGKTGYISKEDFFCMLGSQQIDAQGETVRKAMKALGISSNDQTISYDDFGKMLLLLESHFHPLIDQQSLQNASMEISKFFDNRKTLTSAEIKLLLSVSNFRLSEREHKALFDFIDTNGGNIDVEEFVKGW